MNLYSFFYFSMLWVDLLPILFFVIFSKRLKLSLDSLLLILFVTTSATLQWLCHFMASEGKSTVLIINLYNIFEFFILYFICKNQIDRKFHILTTYIAIPIFLVLFCFEFNSKTLMQNTLITS
jgi:hypothetical protein